MSAQENVNVQATADGLLLSGAQFEEGKPWQARALGRNRLLLDLPGTGPQNPGDKAGFGVMER